MQINPSLPQQSEIIRDVPARLLLTLVEGQRVEATVIARLTANTVRIQVGDSVVQLTTRQPLQPGQQIVIQRGLENGQPVLRINTPVAEQIQVPTTALLRQGQQIAVEVIKLLAQNRLLVAPILVSNMGQQGPVIQNPQGVTVARLPAQIEVDISALKQPFRVGDRLVLEVLREQPLSVALKANSPTRAEVIQQYQRELLPQFARTSPAFSTLNQLSTVPPLAEPVRQGITQLVQGLTDKTLLQQPEGLRQALNNSGLFLENRVRQAVSEPVLRQDFKANLLQLAQVLKAALSQSNQARVMNNPELLQKLPAQVQTALRQLVNTPQELTKLPAQVTPALASRGQTPMQLLLSLLSGMATSSSPMQTPPGAANLSVTQLQSMTALQTFIQSRQADNVPSQLVSRVVEWQLLRDLLREVESATARIQFNQLSMLRDPDSPSNVNVWLFDLPVKDKQQMEMLQLRLEQHSPKLNSGEEAIWQVQLNLETQNLGPMQARISLLEQDVKVVLLAEREESASLLANHIEALNQRLEKLGVNVSHLSCRQASITPLTPHAPVNLPEHLLDISV